MSSCKNHSLYEQLNQLVFEYLEINGLEKTLESFTSECHSKSLPCPSGSPDHKAAFTQYDSLRLLQAFDNGQQEQFFKYWNTFQTHIQVTTNDMAKLEVYIRVHFALWPRAKNESMECQEEAMQKLKEFFEQNKSTLGKDAGLLPLFALPFVEDPYVHPIFKELFKESWTRKLRKQLESTLQKYFELLQENICQQSRLADLVARVEKLEEQNVHDHDGSGSVELESPSDTADYKKRFYQLLGNHQKIRKLLQGTRESYAKILLVAHELVMALEQAVSGDPALMHSTLHKCYLIFPEIFTPDNSDNSQNEILIGVGPDINHFKKLSSTPNFDPTDDSEVSLFFLGLSNVSPEFLDFKKIKSVLTSETSSVSEKLCLLQALRWLLTKCTESSRKLALDAFIQNDIFGITQPDEDYKDKLFLVILSPEPTYQKECLARLLNAMSSTKVGRQYLSTTTFVVDALIRSLASFNGPKEGYILQMVVASLQKLSLKKNMRLFMIEHEMIDWLIDFINTNLNKYEYHKETEKETTTIALGDQHSDDRDTEPGNPYLMEYAWALLMNLCLHSEAWPSCIQNGSTLIVNACKMLNMTSKQDLAPYIVSTLFSLLRCPELYALTKGMQLENMLAPLLAESNELSEHLKNLISLLALEGCDRITSTRETNYDDEDNQDPEVMEPEIELTESWTSALDETDLTGDDLLLRHYFIDQKETEVTEDAPSASGSNNYFENGEIKRPITPLHSSAKGKSLATNVPKGKGNRPDSAANESTDLNKKVKGATLKAQSTGSSVSIAPSEISDSNANRPKRQVKKSTTATKNPNSEKVKGSKMSGTEELPLNPPLKGLSDRPMTAGLIEGGGEPI